MSKHTYFFKSFSAAIAALFLFLFVTDVSAQQSIRLFRVASGAKMNSAFSANSTYLSVDHQALASVLHTSGFTLQNIPLPHVEGLPQSVDLDLTEFSVITEKT